MADRRKKGNRTFDCARCGNPLVRNPKRDFKVICKWCGYLNRFDGRGRLLDEETRAENEP